MLKKTFSVFLIIFILFSVPVFAVDYDEEGAYKECCTLYPDFVQKVKDNGVTDKQITVFLSSVEEHLLTRDGVLTEENFDDYMFEAIKYAFNLRKNIRVRNALSKAYPDSIADAIDGIITDEFRPIYDTVKRFLFGIKTPIVTISVKHDDENVIYAHSAYLPENTFLTLAAYDTDGMLVHVKCITPNFEEDGIHCSCHKLYRAKVFAWDDSLIPVCAPYEVIFEIE